PEGSSVPGGKSLTDLSERKPSDDGLGALCPGDAAHQAKLAAVKCRGKGAAHPAQPKASHACSRSGTHQDTGGRRAARPTRQGLASARVFHELASGSDEKLLSHQTGRRLPGGEDD
ncbi:hypothetical protein chiPu_0024551, partial [Chiloscyllium punctatum]|nr:hypothetical protein [Chiloscyllium punctatum]